MRFLLDLSSAFSIHAQNKTKMNLFFLKQFIIWFPFCCFCFLMSSAFFLIPIRKKKNLFKRKTNKFRQKCNIKNLFIFSKNVYFGSNKSPKFLTKKQRFKTPKKNQAKFGFSSFGGFLERKRLIGNQTKKHQGFFKSKQQILAWNL